MYLGPALLVLGLATAIQHPAYQQQTKHHHRQHDYRLQHQQQSIAAPSEQEEDSFVCRDATFYLDMAKRVPFEKAVKHCPEGFQLAHLDGPEMFRYAGVFLFGCLGPAKEAWVASAMGTIYGQGDPIKLTAPDAIEKGGMPLSIRTDRKRQEALAKSYQVPPGGPTRPPPRINVRSQGQVQLDETDVILPFLCQAIPASPSEEKFV